MKIAIVILVHFILLFLPRGTPAVTVVDQAGRSVQVPESPQRIIALAPSITEIVYYLHRQDRLVGATQYSNYPPAAKKLPRVGSYIRLDIEKIVALGPDLCLGIKDGNPEQAVKRIEALGIPVFVIDPRSLEDIIDVVKRFGTLLGTAQESGKLVRDMRQRIAGIRSKIAGVGTRPKVFFQIDAAPIISAGNNTFIHELISLAGGTNMAAGSVQYPRFNWEDILRLQPEIVLIASMAGGHSPDKLEAGWRRWPQIPAVRRNRIHVVDANLVDRPTPRLVEGLELFARIIHPELFGDGREK